MAPVVNSSDGARTPSIGPGTPLAPKPILSVVLSVDKCIPFTLSSPQIGVLSAAASDDTGDTQRETSYANAASEIHPNPPLFPSPRPEAPTPAAIHPGPALGAGGSSG